MFIFDTIITFLSLIQPVLIGHLALFGLLRVTNFANFNQFVCTKKNLSWTICFCTKKANNALANNRIAKVVRRFELDSPTFPLDKDNKTSPRLVTKVKKILFRDTFKNKHENKVSVTKKRKTGMESKK